MSASPEFYRPPAPLPLGSRPQYSLPPADDDNDDSSSCRTPTARRGAGIAYLRREATTCPPAPRKPKQPSSCKKRLFHQDNKHYRQQQEAPAPVVISLPLDELQRLFRPVDEVPVVEPEPKQQCDDKRRRRLRSATLRLC